MGPLTQPDVLPLRQAGLAQAYRKDVPDFSGHPIRHPGVKPGDCRIGDEAEQSGDRLPLLLVATNKPTYGYLKIDQRSEARLVV